MISLLKRALVLIALVIPTITYSVASAWAETYCTFTEDYEVLPGGVLNFNIPFTIKIKKGISGKVLNDLNTVKHLEILNSNFTLYAYSNSLACAEAASANEFLKISAALIKSKLKLSKLSQEPRIVPFDLDTKKGPSKPAFMCVKSPDGRDDCRRIQEKIKLTQFQKNLQESILRQLKNPGYKYKIPDTSFDLPFNTMNFFK